MNVEYKKMSIQSLCLLLRDSNWSKPQIGATIGVTELQVYNYMSGKTLTPKVNVCKNVWDNIKVEGKPVLINVYNTPEELEQHYEIANKTV
jgi:hypothetical protein